MSATTRPRRRLAAGAGLAAAALLLSACGSDSTGTSASTTTVDQAGLERADAALAEASVRPTQIPNSTPIDKPIPSNKSVTFLSCGTSTCNLEADIIKQATDKLGWKFTSLANDGTPEGIKKGWQQILRDKPDGVIYSATPVASFKKELDEAAAAGIEVVACCTTDPADGQKLDFVVGTPEQTAPDGDLLANFVISDSKGKGNALFVTVSAFEIISAIQGGFEDTIASNCPACSTDTLDIPMASIGKDVTDRIVSYLRSHPDTKYVVLSIDGALGVGLPAALKAAGLNDVTVVGDGPDTTTLQYIESGLQKATVTFPYYEEMFAQVDALARIFAGVDPEENVTIPRWFVTEDTLPTATEIFPVVEDVQEQYFALWGVA